MLNPSYSITCDKDLEKRHKILLGNLLTVLLHWLHTAQ